MIRDESHSISSYRLGDREWTILGAADDCDIYIRGLQIPLYAVRLRWNARSCRLSVLKHRSSNVFITDVTGVNHESLELVPGNWFSVGPLQCSIDSSGTLSFEVSPIDAIHLAGPIQEAPTRRAVYTDDTSQLKILAVLQLRPNEFLTLGSKTGCALVVDQPGIPGLAAKVRWDPTGATLNVFRHRAADRGVFLQDGIGIHESTELKNGQWFEIAGTKFTWLGSDSLLVSEGNRPELSTLPQQDIAAEDAITLQLQGLVLPIGPRSTPQKRLEATFDAPSNRIVALCGPSGVGKTTLLRALISSHAKSRQKVGSIVLGKEALDTGGQGHQHVVALVPQETILAADITMGQMILDAYWLKRKPGGGPNEVSRTISQALLYSGLSTVYNSHPDSYISSFSGGQQKRISLALELMSVPDILLLDEPDSGLDPASGKRLMQSLDQIAKSPSIKVIIVVTHTLRYLPDDAHVVLLGIKDASLREVAWQGQKTDMYACLKVNENDDATIMEKLETGAWEVEEQDSAMAHPLRINTPQKNREWNSSSIEATIPVTNRSSGRMRTLVRREFKRPFNGWIPEKPGESKRTERLRRWMYGYLKVVWVILAFPAIAAIIARAVLDEGKLGFESRGSVSALLVVLTVVGFGSVGLTASGVIGDWKILGRESLWGVRAWQHVVSKFLGSMLPAGVLGALAALFFESLVTTDRGTLFDNNYLFLSCLLVCYCWSCTALGLAVSSLVRGVRSTIYTIMAVLSAFVILSDIPIALEDLSTGPRQLFITAALFMPSRWAGAAWAAQIRLEDANMIGNHGSLWISSWETVLYDGMGLLACVLFYLLVASASVRFRALNVILNK